MHPLLLIGAIVIVFLLWLLCSFLYRPIGRLFGRLWDDAKKAMREEAKAEAEEIENENDEEN